MVRPPSTPLAAMLAIPTRSLCKKEEKEEEEEEEEEEKSHAEEEAAACGPH